MLVQDILAELETLGNKDTKRIWMAHGAKEPFFGVKVEDLKKIQKRIKKDYILSMQLFQTGNSDAMYLAGLIADPPKMTLQDIQMWADTAYWYMISEYTVAWVASESHYATELAEKWILSDQENIASAGWGTWSAMVAIKSDADLDLSRLHQLLEHVAQHIHQSPNRVRYVMNGFVIATGVYVTALTEKAIAVAQQIGKVSVVLGGAGCKVPLATDYIYKVQNMNKLGKKRKSPRC